MQHDCVWQAPAESNTCRCPCNADDTLCVQPSQRSTKLHLLLGMQQHDARLAPASAAGGACDQHSLVATSSALVCHLRCWRCVASSGQLCVR